MFAALLPLFIHIFGRLFSRTICMRICRCLWNAPLPRPPPVFPILAARAFSFFPHDCRLPLGPPFGHLPALPRTHPPICLHVFSFFLPPAASLFIFYAPLTTFARFTFPVSGGGSDVFESLIVVACLFATPPPPLSCCPLHPPRPACRPAAPAARFVV